MNKVIIPKKYKPLFTSKTRYSIVSGGRGSGKSYSVALYLLLLTMEKDNVILFSRYTMSSIPISVFPEFIEKIERFNLSFLFEITKNEIINKATGSRIIFKGIKTGSSIQTANLKSIAGLNIVVIDEAEEIPTEDIFDKIDYSVRRIDKPNKIILVFNPTTKANWIYTKFFELNGLKGGENIIKDESTYIHTTYLDNIKNLDESFLKQIEKMKISNPKKYEHIILGGFLDKAEGVIFNNWSIGEFNNNISYEFGADFGWSLDPNTLIKVALDTNKKKIWIKEELYQTGLTTSELSNIFKNKCDNKLIVADLSEGRLIEEIKRNGLNIIPCTKGAGSVKEGILLLQDYELIVDSSSINLIKELNNYRWSPTRDEPIDMYNHLLDALRYVVTNRLKERRITKYRIR
jgi:phage terminase large subunit